MVNEMENALITTIKDQVAQEHDYLNWMEVMDALHYKDANMDDDKFEHIVSKAMHRLAEHCCKEQREQCRRSLFGYMIHKDYRDDVDRDILSSPLASDKYKP